MSDQLLGIEKRDGITVLTLNAPRRKNALSMTMRAALYQALLDAEDDEAVRCVVLTGADRFFSAGGDLTEMKLTGLAAARTRMRRNVRLIEQMLTMSTPLVAAVEGAAAGAGFSVAMACDTVVCGRGARFVAGFGRVGLSGDMGLFHTLPQRVGAARAKQILMYSEVVEAERAERLGMVDRVVDDGAALDEALTCAARLCEQAPLSVAITKAVFAGNPADAFAREVDLQSQLLLSGDHREGRTAFLEKRRPQFTGQ